MGVGWMWLLRTARPPVSGALGRARPSSTWGCNRGWGVGVWCQQEHRLGAGGVLCPQKGCSAGSLLCCWATPRAHPVIYGQGHPCPQEEQVQPLAQDPKAEPWGDLLAVPFHQSPPPLPSWGNHTPCPAGAPGRHGLAWSDELPRAVIPGHVRAKGSLESVSCLLVFMEGNGPRGESEQTQGVENSAHSWGS